MAPEPQFAGKSYTRHCLSAQIELIVSEQTMLAGESLIEGPAVGSLRLVRGQVVSCMNPDDVRPGLLVQEYEEDSTDRTAWRTVCPLTDAHFMVTLCPPRWYRASVKLRDMMEGGEAVSLADELAALKH